MTKFISSLALGAALAFGAPDAAQAQTKQDGLVNVVVGDVTILRNVDVGVAANVIAQICGVSVDAVVGVIAAVDQTSRTASFCRTGDGKARVVQN